jgi:hypothetical protein
VGLVSERRSAGRLPTRSLHEEQLSTTAALRCGDNPLDVDRLQRSISPYFSGAVTDEICREL